MLLGKIWQSKKEQSTLKGGDQTFSMNLKPFIHLIKVYKWFKCPFHKKLFYYRHSQEDPQKDVVSKTELTLTGSLRSAGSMASSAGSAMVAGIQVKASRAYLA
jgi:hypothetical protein